MIDGTLQQQWNTNPIVSKNAQLDAMLSHYKFIDMGKISALLDGGKRALVTSLGLNPSKYECEIISIGNLGASIQPATSGQFVLILFPYTNINLLDNSLNVHTSNWSSKYAKCIPIGLGNTGSIKVDADADSFTIASSKYSCVFMEDKLQITDLNSTISIDMEGDNMRIAEGTTQVKMTTDSIDVVVAGEYDAQGELSSCSAQFKLDADGITLKANNLKIDGDVEITGNLSAADGNFTAEV